MPEDKTSQSPTATESFVERHEDFTSLYANNVQFEVSTWDLKMVFGELDQSDPPGKSKVIQHTAMTVTWLQAKIMAYYLNANILLHEADYGKIQIPANLHPVPLPALPDEIKANERARQARVQIEHLRQELIE